MIETSDLRVVAHETDGVYSYDFRYVVYQDGEPYTCTTDPVCPRWSDYPGEPGVGEAMAEFAEALERPVVYANELTYERMRALEERGHRGTC